MLLKRVRERGFQVVDRSERENLALKRRGGDVLSRA